MKGLITGIKGAQGPCVSRDGRVFVVGPDETRVVEVCEGGRSADIANTGSVPAGLQLDRNNDLWCADMKLGILRISLQGRIYSEATKFENAPIRGCNECCFG